MEMLVSILMPFRDTAAYLPECLDSIRNQGYEFWELIAVDDHSSDESRHILEEYALKDARIRIASNDGAGIIPALRKSYSLSKGQVITRMDSDDRMSVDRLEEMVGQLRDCGAGHIALGQVRYFSDRGISDGYARYERWLNRLIAKGTNFSEIYKECVIPSPCWMVFREDLEASGAFFPNRYPEDYDLCFRFYEAGLKCISTPKLLHYWRDYDQRTSRTSEHYAQNYFLEIKLYYFLKLDRDASRALVIWGAGSKGKTISKMLKDQEQAFHWLCDNPKKIGKRIYGVSLEHYTLLGQLEDSQSIVTVANSEAQKEIRDYLDSNGQQEGIDYFFFC
jgi:glycosyltransferase involved in cell wall biosynthesis